MKRIHYGGQSLVTGTDVADALIVYAKAVARMDSSASVEIPVLEGDGSVAMHTLLLTATTPLEMFEIDGDVEVDDEAERFVPPDFPAVGGKAVAISSEDIAEISLPIAD